jgi:peroxiredoxin
MTKQTSHAFKGNRPLSSSRINRSGLAKGTTAPLFKLPLLAGGEISLDAYRGRRVLLVFTDPKCGPCRELMPELASFHKRTPDIEILAVSRGNIEGVRSEFAEQPVPFPVALQKSWEISRRYAMFATPIAYLIDEGGKIAGDIAVGPEPILILLASAQILTLVKSVKQLKDALMKKAKARQAPRAKRKQAAN